MTEFDRLVSQQLKTMDQLLDLQLELERCQQLEHMYAGQGDQNALGELQEQVQRMKGDLLAVQQAFEQQTQQVILSFQQEKIHS